MSTAFRPVTPGSPEITIEPDLIRGPRVSVEGAPLAARRERGRPVYPIPMADGTERPMTLHGAFMGLRARFDDREYEIEPRLRTLELFLVLLPLGLITLVWPIGALVGAFGVMVALVIMRRPWPFAARALAIVAGFAAALLVLGPAGLIG
jgi:hypothetical protein